MSTGGKSNYAEMREERQRIQKEKAIEKEKRLIEILENTAR